MITIRLFSFNPFQENTFVVHDETLECVIIDPGCYTEREKEDLAEYIAANNLRPVYLLNTHCHVDHILGNAFVAEKYGLVACCHRSDFPLLQGADDQGMLFGLRITRPPSAVQFLSDGDVVRFGHTTLRIIHLPGHSEGSIAFFFPDDHCVFAGDVLFLGGIGRTDLPGGNYRVLIGNIMEKLFPLGDDIIVYPGHGPETTTGYERLNNPFLA